MSASNADSFESDLSSSEYIAFQQKEKGSKQKNSKKPILTSSAKNNRTENKSANINTKFNINSKVKNENFTSNLTIDKKYDFGQNT